MRKRERGRERVVKMCERYGNSLNKGRKPVKERKKERKKEQTRRCNTE